jgi:hypothetical protein
MYTYMVQAVKLEGSSSGSYFNPSQGIIFTPGGNQYHQQWQRSAVGQSYKPAQQCDVYSACKHHACRNRIG